MDNIQQYNQYIAEYMEYRHMGLKNNGQTFFNHNINTYTLDEMLYNVSWDWLMPVVDEITRREGGNYLATIQKLRCTLVKSHSEDNVFNNITLMHKAVGMWCELHQDFSDEVKQIATDIVEARWGDRTYLELASGRCFRKEVEVDYREACVKYSRIITL